eukprot:scaffold57784_cov24-Tisochrysis_lutea.AAC.2
MYEYGQRGAPPHVKQVITLVEQRPRSASERRERQGGTLCNPLSMTQFSSRTQDKQEQATAAQAPVRGGPGFNAAVHRERAEMARAARTPEPGSSCCLASRRRDCWAGGWRKRGRRPATATSSRLVRGGGRKNCAMSCARGWSARRGEARHVGRLRPPQGGRRGYASRSSGRAPLPPGRGGRVGQLSTRRGLR